MSQIFLLQNAGLPSTGAFLYLSDDGSAPNLRFPCQYTSLTPSSSFIQLTPPVPAFQPYQPLVNSTLTVTFPFVNLKNSLDEQQPIVLSNVYNTTGKVTMTTNQVYPISTYDLVNNVGSPTFYINGQYFNYVPNLSSTLTYLEPVNTGTYGQWYTVSATGVCDNPKVLEIADTYPSQSTTGIILNNTGYACNITTTFAGVTATFASIPSEGTVPAADAPSVYVPIPYGALVKTPGFETTQISTVAEPNAVYVLPAGVGSGQKGKMIVAKGKQPSTSLYFFYNTQLPPSPGNNILVPLTITSVPLAPPDSCTFVNNLNTYYKIGVLAPDPYVDTPSTTQTLISGGGKTATLPCRLPTPAMPASMLSYQVYVVDAGGNTVPLGSLNTIGPFGTPVKNAPVTLPNGLVVYVNGVTNTPTSMTFTVDAPTPIGTLVPSLPQHGSDQVVVQNLLTFPVYTAVVDTTGKQQTESFLVKPNAFQVMQTVSNGNIVVKTADDAFYVTMPLNGSSALDGVIELTAVSGMTAFYQIVAPPPFGFGTTFPNSLPLAPNAIGVTVVNLNIYSVSVTQNGTKIPAQSLTAQNNILLDGAAVLTTSSIISPALTSGARWQTTAFGTTTFTVSGNTTNPLSTLLSSPSTWNTSQFYGQVDSSKGVHSAVTIYIKDTNLYVNFSLNSSCTSAGNPTEATLSTFAPNGTSINNYTLNSTTPQATAVFVDDNDTVQITYGGNTSTYKAGDLFKGSGTLGGLLVLGQPNLSSATTTTPSQVDVSLSCLWSVQFLLSEMFICSQCTQYSSSKPFAVTVSYANPLYKGDNLGKTITLSVDNPSSAVVAFVNPQASISISTNVELTTVVPYSGTFTDFISQSPGTTFLPATGQRYIGLSNATNVFGISVNCICGPTAAGNPTAAHPTAAHPTAAHPTAAHPTAAHPTAAHPTSAHPTAAHPTSAHPTGAHVFLGKTDAIILIMVCGSAIIIILIALAAVALKSKNQA